MKTFEAFVTEQRAAGCDEVVERRWPPDTVIDTHTHAFTADALVVEGEMWLMAGDSTQHLRPGDRFHVEAGTPHAERYGPQGATYWVARRNQRA